MKVHEMSRNAYIIDNFETEEVILQSYNSKVAVYDKECDILTLGRHWDYSVTTLKHVYRFLEEYIPTVMDKLATSRTKKRSIETLIAQGAVFYNPEMV